MIAVKTLYILILVSLAGTAYGQSNLPACQGSDSSKWDDCYGSWIDSSGKKYTNFFTYGVVSRKKFNGQGAFTYPNDDKYVGDYKDGQFNGQGTYINANGEKHVGEWNNGNLNGQAIKFKANGSINESGIYKDGKLVTSQYIDPNSFTRIARNNIAQDDVPYRQKNLPLCPAPKTKANSTILDYSNWTNCFGKRDIILKQEKARQHYDSGRSAVYEGNFLNGSPNGWGEIRIFNGNIYVGEFKNGEYHGEGIRTTADGRRFEGLWEKSEFIRELKVNIPSLITNTTSNVERVDLERERQQLADERRRLDTEKAQIEQEKKVSRIVLKSSASQPDANGDFTITIQTGADTASLKIDGEEVGGRRDGNYVIRRVARVGEQNSYLITARDVFGNTDSATITVARQVVDSRPVIPRLNPSSVKVQQSRDAVAIIIGIENYRRVPKADFANADAKDFYTYASRALGIKPENIKLLVDDGADDIEILNAFQNWLPLKVNKGKTDVYVFYSGHGYPSLDGSSLYFLPFNVDKQYLERTSVKQKEVVTALQKAQAKSVTMFIDACYSGQTRGGEVLIAGLKPIALKADEKAYPPEFTVITASTADQFSSASQDLKHGIFSFYLMKGMEGDADLNKDGRTTSGELQRYLSEMVGRQAMGLNRTQNTQLFGDADRVLVGR